jgi:hypothetical protein
MNENAPAPAPVAKRKGRPVLTTVIALSTFLFGLMLGSIGNSADASAAAAQTAPQPTYSAPAPTYSVPTYQAPAPAPVTQAPAPAAPAVDTITNGTYEIGTEVQPGKYKSPGPESGVIQLCYVDVQRGDKFLAQEVSNDGQVRIEIPASWKGALMEVSGCQPLVKVG